MRELSDTYAIARIDLPGAGTHGWQVRVQFQGVKYAKYFSDRKHGGRRAACLKARGWRNRLLRSLKVGEVTRVCRRSERNRSGVVGVSRVTVAAANGVSYHFWQAAWSPGGGKRRSVKFSILRHGDQGAFQRAVEARRKGAGG